MDLTLCKMRVILRKSKSEGTHFALFGNVAMSRREREREGERELKALTDGFTCTCCVDYVTSSAKPLKHFCAALMLASHWSFVLRT
jgi:hypothetical protein